MVGEVGNEGIRVRDKFSGLLFQHEFPTTEAGKVDIVKVEAHLAVAKAKFLYLKQKLINAIKDSANCVLVRAENGLTTLDAGIEKINQMRNAFIPINPDIKIVLASQRFEHEYQHPEFLLVRLQPCADWAGDFPSWDRLFTLSENLL